MIIRSIELRNFRNYENLDIAFDKGTNILYGDNAQGKTNILEAAYMSGTTKSHKGSRDKEMIRFEENEAHIRTVVEKNEKQFQIDMHLRRNGAKGVAINKIPIKKASELFGILNIVFFSPEDLIIDKRKTFVDELNQIIQQIHSNISGGRENLILKYEPNIDDIFFEDELSRAKNKDLKLCQTTVGPHRDDMLFSIDGVDIRKYGSQGQQRTSALSLKLSEIDLVRKSIHNTPVLLLDDVLSELDSNRQNYLLNSITDIQTIITCTGLEEFVKNRFQIDKIFQVISGEVFEKKTMEEI